MDCKIIKSFEVIREKREYKILIFGDDLIKCLYYSWQRLGERLSLTWRRQIPYRKDLSFQHEEY